jgi:Dyp-type peroxidase family
VLGITSGQEAALQQHLDSALGSQDGLPGVSVIHRLDVGMLPTTRTHLGYMDGIGAPVIEGDDSPVYPGQGPAIKAGEFILGYRDERGNLPPMPQPEALGRNGTYLAFRKLRSHVAEFRQFLRANAESPEEEEWLHAKMVGRWSSGAPLVLAPERDDPELGADRQRNNDFGYYEEDPKGLKCPAGAHIRRVNPRDALKDTLSDVNIHRVLRRGFTYGPMLPEGAMEDDGVERGLYSSSWAPHLPASSSSSSRRGRTTATSWSSTTRRTRSSGRTTARSPSRGDRYAGACMAYPGS